MQELRFVAVSEDGSYAILGIPGRSGRFTLPIDDRLRAVARGQFARLAQYEIEVENPLRPKEIQARIRAGETVEEIADAAGVAVDRVRWFEGPVLAERTYTAQRAQGVPVRHQGGSPTGPPLGDVVAERLAELDAGHEEVQWDSRKRGDGYWQVQLVFTVDGRPHIAEWLYDPRRGHVSPADDNAARLSLPVADLPAPDRGSLGQANVTPLRQRHERQATPQQPPAAERALERPLAHAEDTAREPGAARAREEATESVQAPVRAAAPDGPPTRHAPSASPTRSEATDLAGATPVDPEAIAAPGAAAQGSVDAGPGGTAGVDADAADGAARPGGDSAPHDPSTDESADCGKASGRRTPARNRRSSVPSWDEIMLGNSRRRDEG